MSPTFITPVDKNSTPKKSLALMPAASGTVTQESENGLTFFRAHSGQRLVAAPSLEPTLQGKEWYCEVGNRWPLSKEVYNLFWMEGQQTRGTLWRYAPLDSYWRLEREAAIVQQCAQENSARPSASSSTSASQVVQPAMSYLQSYTQRPSFSRLFVKEMLPPAEKAYASARLRRRDGAQRRSSGQSKIPDPRMQ